MLGLAARHARQRTVLHGSITVINEILIRHESYEEGGLVVTMGRNQDGSSVQRVLSGELNRCYVQASIHSCAPS